MSKCKHVQLKRKLISAGKDKGHYKAYCSQQCKHMVEFDITDSDILNVYPRGRPINLNKKLEIVEDDLNEYEDLLVEGED
jgi:hypothetical protein